MNELKAVGYIKSQFKEQTDPFEMAKHESTIIINEEFEEGLYDIESSPFIDVIFLFHKSEGYKLRHLNYFNEDKGVFASRSPRRPNPVGVTTVKLLQKTGNSLLVSGLDALDGTPVIDIKPTNVNFFKEHFTDISKDRIKENPRWEISRAIKTNNLEFLLLEAGKMHGHFCPGLALGIRMATYAMQQIKEHSDGMEDLIAISETNNCSSDGIQFVTGCSFGNNALVFKDFGKTAFTLAKRNGEGIRISRKNDSMDYLQTINPEFYEQFKKVVIDKDHNPEEKVKLRALGTKASLSVLDVDFDRLFKVEEVKVKLPEYAPIYENIICDRCGEVTMGSRIINKNGSQICLSCNEKDYKMLDGHGIHCV